MTTMSMKKRSKGQMFLIAGVVIVASLVIIKFNMAAPSAKKEQESMEVRFENDIFVNIVNELNNTLRISSNNPQNITNNVFDFANFTERKISEHSMDFTFLYVGIIANKTTNSLNVTLINMLDGTIDANLSINTTPTQSNATAGIANYGRWNTDFTMTAGGKYGLNLTYNSTSGDSGTTKLESIEVVTKNNKDVYIGFFYVMLASEDATHAGKYQKTTNIN